MKRILPCAVALLALAVLAGCPPPPPPVTPATPSSPRSGPVQTVPGLPPQVPTPGATPAQPPETQPRANPPSATQLPPSPDATPTGASASAEAKAAQTQCMSQLKQLGLAALMYCQDYNEKMAPAGRWTACFTPYMKSAELLRCPSAPRLPVGYGYNRLISLKALGSLPRPAETPLLMDCNVGGANPAVEPHWERSAERRLIRRHEGGCNVGFSDGHVKWMQAP